MKIIVFIFVFLVLFNSILSQVLQSEIRKLRNEFLESYICLKKIETNPTFSNFFSSYQEYKTRTEILSKLSDYKEEAIFDIDVDDTTLEKLNNDLKSKIEYDQHFEIIFNFLISVKKIKKANSELLSPKFENVLQNEKNLLQSIETIVNYSKKLKDMKKILKDQDFTVVNKLKNNFVCTENNAALELSSIKNLEKNVDSFKDIEEEITNIQKDIISVQKRINENKGKLKVIDSCKNLNDYFLKLREELPVISKIEKLIYVYKDKKRISETTFKKIMIVLTDFNESIFKIIQKSLDQYLENLKSCLTNQINVQKAFRNDKLLLKLNNNKLNLFQTFITTKNKILEESNNVEKLIAAKNNLQTQYCSTK